MPQRESPPERTEQHDALAVFLGHWRAEGWSYGSPDQRADAPKSNRERWDSTHTGAWHTGGFFLVQDERALIGEARTPFDTLGVMGVDPDTGDYFVQSFENHGYARRYAMRRDGNVWTLEGALERARIEFGDGGNAQTIMWEWLKDGTWLPLCDRVAIKKIHKLKSLCVPICLASYVCKNSFFWNR